jgi:hypothetical protein
MGKFFTPLPGSVKKCSSCVLNKKTVDGYPLFDVCTIFKRTNVYKVDSQLFKKKIFKYEYEYSIQCRFDENKCGINGKHHMES